MVAFPSRAAFLAFDGEGVDPTNWNFTAAGPSIVSDAFSARAGEHIAFDFSVAGTWRTGILIADLLDAGTGTVVQHLYTDSVGQWQDRPNPMPILAPSPRPAATGWPSK